MTAQGAYKFLDKKDVHLVMGGSFQFGSLDHYRHSEAAHIGDPLEGSRLIEQSGRVVVGEASSTFQENLRNFGILVGPNAVMEDNRFIRSIDGFHIFCFSVGPLAQLRSHWAEYSGCIQIRRVRAFAETIVQHGVVTLDAHSDPLPLREITPQLVIGDVKYDGRAYNLNEANHPAPNPFEKFAKFASDRECRLVFRAQKKIPDLVQIQAPRATQFLQVIE